MKHAKADSNLTFDENMTLSEENNYLKLKVSALETELGFYKKLVEVYEKISEIQKELDEQSK